ncbi:unnamed protein product [Chrysoparadoxa australica]
MATKEAEGGGSSPRSNEGMPPPAPVPSRDERKSSASDQSISTGREERGASEHHDGEEEVFAKQGEEEKGNKVEETSPQGRYHRYAERLGSGQYKNVYRAYDTSEGIEVAWNTVNIKLLPGEEKKRILNEVRLLQNLEHRNLVQFHGSWVNREKEQVIFVTEIVVNGSLREFIRKVQLIRWRVVKRWAKQILRGLQYLHSKDPPIIHRDLKCDNIFINGHRGDIRIGDLGLSTSNTRTDKTMSVLGTPEFMAPELYDESYNEKVDIYAFGMCMLEMTSKERPYNECTNAAQIYKKVVTGVQPEVLERIANKRAKDFIGLCLNYDAAKRPSAEDLLEHPFLTDDNPAEDNSEVLLLPVGAESKESSAAEQQLQPAYAVKPSGSLGAASSLSTIVEQQGQQQQVGVSVVMLDDASEKGSEAELGGSGRDQGRSKAVAEDDAGGSGGGGGGGAVVAEGEEQESDSRRGSKAAGAGGAAAVASSKDQEDEEMLADMPNSETAMKKLKLPEGRQEEDQEDGRELGDGLPGGSGSSEGKGKIRDSSAAAVSGAAAVTGAGPSTPLTSSPPAAGGTISPVRSVADSESSSVSGSVGPVVPVNTVNMERSRSLEVRHNSGLPPAGGKTATAPITQPQGGPARGSSGTGGVTPPARSQSLSPPTRHGSISRSNSTELDASPPHLGPVVAGGRGGAAGKAFLTSPAAIQPVAYVEQQEQPQQQHHQQHHQQHQQQHHHQQHQQHISMMLGTAEKDVLGLEMVVYVEGEDKTHRVNFDFHLEHDRPETVALEMVNELSLPAQELPEIVQAIQGEVNRYRLGRTQQQQSKQQQPVAGSESLNGNGAYVEPTTLVPGIASGTTASTAHLLEMVAPPPIVTAPAPDALAEDPAAGVPGVQQQDLRERLQRLRIGELTDHPDYVSDTDGDYGDDEKLSKAAEEHARKKRQVQKAFHTRLVNLQKAQEDCVDEHSRTEEKFKKDFSDYEKKKAKLEIDFMSRMEGLTGEWRDMEDSHKANRRTRREQAAAAAAAVEASTRVQGQGQGQQRTGMEREDERGSGSSELTNGRGDRPDAGQSGQGDNNKGSQGGTGEGLRDFSPPPPPGSSVASHRSSVTMHSAPGDPALVQQQQQQQHYSQDSGLPRKPLQVEGNYHPTGEVLEGVHKQLVSLKQRERMDTA